MPKYQKFLLYWAMHAAVLYIFPMVFPMRYTLGNSFLDPYHAVVITSFLWSLILWLVRPFFKTLDVEIKCTVNNMALGCLLINFATVWMIARYSIITGVGISSFVYVFLMALVANFAQYFAWKKLGKKK
ncbi:phage holin family protein [Candidatus Woesebacteria bacterium]|nr:phage holin family protein [Candidatus Woesebacteria bacterium]